MYGNTRTKRGCTGGKVYHPKAAQCAPKCPLPGERRNKNGQCPSMLRKETQKVKAGISPSIPLPIPLPAVMEKANERKAEMALMALPPLSAAGQVGVIGGYNYGSAKVLGPFSYQRSPSQPPKKLKYRISRLGKR